MEACSVLASLIKGMQSVSEQKLVGSDNNQQQQNASFSLFICIAVN